MSKLSKIRKTVQLFFFITFPITLNYLSPYLIVQGSFEGIVSGSALVFLGLFVSALFFGRSFCSWVCPAGALQDACAGIVNKRVSKRQNNLKYIIWAVWMGAIIAGFISAGGIKGVNMIYMTDGGISVNEPSRYFIYLPIVFLMAVPALIFGRRSPCHSFCWMAPFMVLGTKLKELLRLPARRLTAESAKCISCKGCDKVCPMSLNVNDMVKENKMFHTECILCGQCQDACPKEVLKVGFCTMKSAGSKTNLSA